MRICFFGHTLTDPVGGTVSYTHALAQALVNKGHDVTIVSKLRRGSELYNANSIRYEPISVETEYSFISWYVSYSLKSMAFFMKYRNFDLIHGMASIPSFALLLQLIGFFSRTPIVYSILSPTKFPLRFFGVRNILICVSRNIEEQQRGNGIFIPPFVDLGKFKTVSQYDFRKNGDFIIGTMGVPTSYREILYLVKAIPLILKKYPKAFFVLAINPFGTICTPSLRKRLDTIKNLIREYNLTNHTVILGKVDVPTFFNSLDIFVYPLQTTRGAIDIPPTILEALAAGCCTVSTRVGGISEVIKEGENGILLKEGEHSNPEAYAREVIRLIEDKQLLMKIKSNAPKSVQEYDVEKVIPRILEVYAEVCELR